MIMTKAALQASPKISKKKKKRKIIVQQSSVLSLIFNSCNDNMSTQKKVVVDLHSSEGASDAHPCGSSVAWPAGGKADVYTSTSPITPHFQLNPTTMANRGYDVVVDVDAEVRIRTNVSAIRL